MLNAVKIKIYRLLRRSEKYTHTDMVYLTKGGFWLTLEQAVSMLASFLLAIAFANLIPPQTYGVYKYVLSLAGIFTIATLPGIGTAMIQSVARGYEGSILLGFKTKIKWGLLGGLASLIAAAYYYFQGNETLAISLAITAAFLPFMDSLLIITSLLAGRKNFRSLARYNIFIRVISAAALIGTLFLIKNVILIVFVYFTVNTLLRLVVFGVIYRRHRPNHNKDPRSTAYGKHLSLMKALSVGFGNINNILLFHFIGSQGLALFYFIIAPTEQLRGTFRIIENLMFPKLSSDNWVIPRFTDFIKKIAPFLGVVALIILVYIIVAPWFYKIFFPQYIEAVALSRVFSISLLLTVVNMLLSNILKAKRRIREQYLISACDIALGLIITLPMIYFYGVKGLVFSIMAIKILEMFLLSFFTFKEKSFFGPKKQA